MAFCSNSTCGHAEAEWLVEEHHITKIKPSRGFRVIGPRCEICRVTWWSNVSLTPFSPYRKLLDLLEMEKQ